MDVLGGGGEEGVNVQRGGGGSGLKVYVGEKEEG